MKIFTLIRAFQKAKGRSPSPNELAQLNEQIEELIRLKKIEDFEK